MTLNELANSKALEWGMANDFSTVERIKLFAISGRASIIQRRYDQTKIFPQSIIMTLKCKDVIKVEQDECDSCFDCGEVALWRSKDKIPLPIIVRDDSYFMFVGIGPRSFSSIKPEEVQDLQYRKFSGNENFYFYANNYLWFTKAHKSFTARFVPENPLAILALGECDCGCIVDGELILEDSLIEGIHSFLKDKMPMILKEPNEVTIDGNN